jgi:hypothetical protein
MTSGVTYHRDIEQNTIEWDEIRLGRPTASEFSKLLTPAKLEPSKQVDDYALEITAERWSGQPIDRWEGNYWTDRGHELEDQARIWYEMRNGVDVEQCGFIENDLLSAGCSPDGLVKRAGLTEIKCLGAKEHIRTLAIAGIPNKYIPQVQGQMLISERAWVDVIFYHPQLPKKVVRVIPNKEIMDKLIVQIRALHKLVDKYTKVLEAA